MKRCATETYETRNDRRYAMNCVKMQRDELNMSYLQERSIQTRFSIAIFVKTDTLYAWGNEI
eukprot:scaffold29410_cov20-Prasinocladus_malaysianus.AAC.2